MNRPYRQRFTPNRLPGRDDGRESAYESYRQAEFSNSHSGPPIHQGLTSETVFRTSTRQDQYLLSYSFHDLKER